MQMLTRYQPRPPRACCNLMSEQNSVPRGEAFFEQQDTGSLERGAPPPRAGQPTGLFGKEHGRSRLVAATVITGLFYLWPPGIHTASPLLVILYHHPQFCLSAGAGRRHHYTMGGTEEGEKSNLSLGKEEDRRGDYARLVL